MSSAERLAKIIDKMAPLQDQKKVTREALMKHMMDTKQTEITTNGVVFTLKEMKSRPNLSIKYLRSTIDDYNSASEDPIDSADFLNFLKMKRDEEGKSKVTLSHKILS